jgi:hypothetical protein
MPFLYQAGFSLAKPSAYAPYIITTRGMGYTMRRGRGMTGEEDRTESRATQGLRRREHEEKDTPLARRPHHSDVSRGRRLTTSVQWGNGSGGGQQGGAVVLWWSIRRDDGEDDDEPSKVK